MTANLLLFYIQKKQNAMGQEKFLSITAFMCLCIDSEYRIYSVEGLRLKSIEIPCLYPFIQCEDMHNNMFPYILQLCKSFHCKVV